IMSMLDNAKGPDNVEYIRLKRDHPQIGYHRVGIEPIIPGYGAGRFRKFEPDIDANRDIVLFGGGNEPAARAIADVEEQLRFCYRGDRDGRNRIFLKESHRIFEMNAIGSSDLLLHNPG